MEPTAEALARHLAEWFRQHVEPEVNGSLVSVRVFETTSSWAEYVVEDS